MAEDISIWRWVITDNLDARFAALVAASDAEFSEIAAQMMQEGSEELPSDEDIFEQTEAKIRAMDLPPEELATTLAGLKAMREEAAENLAADMKAAEPDPTGRIGVALASSHMFFEEPFASLGCEEIDAEVTRALQSYRAAISKAVGDEGQSLAAYLGREGAALYEDGAFDVVMDAGLSEVDWIWVQGDVALFLSVWHEDKELPIDLEFSRAPLGPFEALKAKLGKHNGV